MGFYDDRAHLAGRVDSAWTPNWDEQWQSGADYNDGDSDDSGDNVDMRNGGSGQATTGGVLSQGDLAN